MRHRGEPRREVQGWLAARWAAVPRDWRLPLVLGTVALAGSVAVLGVLMAWW